MAKSQSRSGSSDNQRNATRQPSKGDRSPPARCFISRYKFVHQPIVRRSAHPLRLVGVPVIGRIAAEPRAQITSAPPGSVIDSLSLGGLGEPISSPRPKVTGAERQRQELAHPPVQMRAHEPSSQSTKMWAGGCEIDFVVNLEFLVRLVGRQSNIASAASPLVTRNRLEFHI